MAVQELCDFARNFTPTLLCIVETQGARVESLAISIGFDKSYAVDRMVEVVESVYFGTTR